MSAELGFRCVQSCRVCIEQQMLCRHNIVPFLDPPDFPNWSQPSTTWFVYLLDLNMAALPCCISGQYGGGGYGAYDDYSSRRQSYGGGGGGGGGYGGGGYGGSYGGGGYGGYNVSEETWRRPIVGHASNILRLRLERERAGWDSMHRRAE